MSDETPVFQLRQYNRYRESLDAWLELHGGFRCGGCGGSAWSLMGYQRVEFSHYSGDEQAMLGYTAGHVLCTACHRIAIYHLTGIETGSPLILPGDHDRA